MSNLLHDLRYGLRVLTRNPGIAAVMVLTLALGIGANTAIFSFLDAILNLHFPIKDQNQIVNLWASNNSSGSRNPLSIPDFLDYRQQNRVFEDLAAFAGDSFHLTNVPEPQSLGGNRVSFNYFHVLGVQPAIGRNFLPEESRGGKARVVILSHGLWRGSFGADPRILGRNITLDRESYTVIGVMPEGFRLFAGNAGLWVPLDLSSSALSRGVRQVIVIGRLKPGVGKERAQADMNNLARRLAQTFPSTNKGWDVQVVLLQDEINKKLGLGLVCIMGPVVLVLLIACANVANLLLARASVREKEMAVRAALGARRLRLVRQLLTENLMLALLAGAFGLLLGVWGMGILRSLFPPVVNGPGALRLDARVLGFALLLCLLTPFLFGLAPALYASKLDLNETLKEGSRGSRAGGSHRLREYLVVLEVGLAVTLLGLGGLFMRFMLYTGSLKPPFDTRNVLAMSLSLSASAYPYNSDVAAFYRRALENARGIPGVESVGVVDRLAVPVEYWSALRPVHLESGSGGELGASAIALRVSPGYFSALRIPLRRGRGLTDEDTSGAARVALVNEALARSWPGGDAVGRRLRLQGLGPETPWITVVGVVGDAIIDIDAGKAPLPGVYLPSAQYPERAMTFVARTLTPPLGLEEPLKRALWAVDEDQPIEQVQTVEQIISREFAESNALVKLIAAFAVLALVLASAGVYSVMSYVVAQRTHEIGVRMSLGARPGDVLRMVGKDALVLVGSGLCVGLVATCVFGRLMGEILTVMGVRSYDPTTLSCVSLVLMAAALLACYLPARRAIKVEPMEALRYE
jgi:putative ABC transport system permease protein